jgi:hypothetical protein
MSGGLSHFPGRPLGQNEVCLRELVAYAEQGLIGQASGRVREAVPEVERRRVTPSPETSKGVDGRAPIVVAEGNGDHSALLD